MEGNEERSWRGRSDSSFSLSIADDNDLIVPGNIKSPSRSSMAEFRSTRLSDLPSYCIEEDDYPSIHENVDDSSLEKALRISFEYLPETIKTLQSSSLRELSAIARMDGFGINNDPPVPPKEEEFRGDSLRIFSQLIQEMEQKIPDLNLVDSRYMLLCQSWSDLEDNSFYSFLSNSMSETPITKLFGVDSDLCILRNNEPFISELVISLSCPPGFTQTRGNLYGYSVFFESSPNSPWPSTAFSDVYVVSATKSTSGFIAPSHQYLVLRKSWDNHLIQNSFYICYLRDISNMTQAIRTLERDFPGHAVHCRLCLLFLSFVYSSDQSVVELGLTYIAQIGRLSLFLPSILFNALIYYTSAACYQIHSCCTEPVAASYWTAIYELVRSGGRKIRVFETLSLYLKALSFQRLQICYDLVAHSLSFGRTRQRKNTLQSNADICRAIVLEMIEHIEATGTIDIHIREFISSRSLDGNLLKTIRTTCEFVPASEQRKVALSLLLVKSVAIYFYNHSLSTSTFETALGNLKDLLCSPWDSDIFSSIILRQMIVPSLVKAVVSCFHEENLLPGIFDILHCLWKLHIFEIKRELTYVFKYLVFLLRTSNPRKRELILNFFTSLINSQDDLLHLYNDWNSHIVANVFRNLVFAIPSAFPDSSRIPLLVLDRLSQIQSIISETPKPISDDKAWEARQSYLSMYRYFHLAKSWLFSQDRVVSSLNDAGSWMVYSNFICFAGLSLGDAFYFYQLHCKMSDTDFKLKVKDFCILYQRDNPNEFQSIQQTLWALDLLLSSQNADKLAYCLLQESWKSLHIGEQNLSRKETTCLSHSGIPFEERIRLGHLVFSEIRSCRWFVKIPVIHNESFPNVFKMFETAWSALVFSIVNVSKFDHASYQEFIQAIEIAGKCSIKFGFEPSFLKSLQEPLAVFQQYVTEYFPPSDLPSEGNSKTSLESDWINLVLSVKKLMDSESIKGVASQFEPNLYRLEKENRKVISISIFKISSPVLGSGNVIAFLCSDVLLFAQLSEGRYEFLEVLHLCVIDPSFCSQRSGIRFQTHSGMYYLRNQDFADLTLWYTLFCNTIRSCKYQWKLEHQHPNPITEVPESICDFCWCPTNPPRRCGWCSCVVCANCKGTEVGIPNSMHKTPLRIDVCSACYSVFRRSH